MGPWAWGPGAPMGPMGPMGPMAWAPQPMCQRLGRSPAKIARMILNYCFGVPRNMQNKADSTLRTSQAVPHPSTNRALRRLTSEVGRDPVHSTRYGRPPATVLGAPGFTGVRLGASTWAQTRPARRPATGAHARPQQAPTHATRDAP